MDYFYSRVNVCIIGTIRTCVERVEFDAVLNGRMWVLTAPIEERRHTLIV